MAEVQAQPRFEPQSTSTDKASLLLRLDELLERYLVTLNDYERVQQELTASLSSGYLSLAQANFNNQSRARYGRDYFDDRMQALRRVKLVENDLGMTFSVSSSGSTPKSSGPEMQNEAEAAEASTEPGISDSAPSFESGAEDKTPSDDNHAPKDPIRWFGILVPPALRSAQTSFISAIEGPVPKLATLTKELRRQEIDVARLRKQIRKL